MPDSSGTSGASGGVIAARMRRPNARSASFISSLTVAWRSAAFLAIARTSTASSAAGRSGRWSVTTMFGWSMRAWIRPSRRKRSRKDSSPLNSGLSTLSATTRSSASWRAS
jgi:hypothetical protein